MNIIKENLKEVTTLDKITDLIVFQKGSNIPKRIKKSLYDTNTITSLGYKVYSALLVQTGTFAPVAFVLQNTLGIIPTYSYYSVGYYALDIDTEIFIEGKTSVIIAQPWSTGLSAIKGYAVADFLGDVKSCSIRTFDLENSLEPTNAILKGNLFEIKVYD